MSTLLQAHGLTRSYVAGHGRCWARVQVLAGLSLTVAEGERVAILGARGAGKTTLLHCLTGLRRLDAGTVRWSTRGRVPYTLCSHPRELGAARVTVVAELPAEGEVAAAWLEGLRDRRGSATGWIVTTSRLAPLMPLCDRALELRDGVLRAVAAPRSSRVAERRPDARRYAHPR